MIWCRVARLRSAEQGLLLRTGMHERLLECSSDMGNKVERVVVQVKGGVGRLQMQVALALAGLTAIPRYGKPPCSSLVPPPYADLLAFACLRGTRLRLHGLSIRRLRNSASGSLSLLPIDCMTVHSLGASGSPWCSLYSQDSKKVWNTFRTLGQVYSVAADDRSIEHSIASVVAFHPVFHVSYVGTADATYPSPPSSMSVSNLQEQRQDHAKYRCS